MSAKTKNTNTVQDTLTDIAQQTGMVLMAAAATMLNLPEPTHTNHKAVLLAPAVYAAEAVNDQIPPQGGVGQQERREREETGPHYASYGVTQRTPGRTGKI